MADVIWHRDSPSRYFVHQWISGQKIKGQGQMVTKCITSWRDEAHRRFRVAVSSRDDTTAQHCVISRRSSGYALYRVLSLYSSLLIKYIVKLAQFRHDKRYSRYTRRCNGVSTRCAKTSIRRIAPLRHDSHDLSLLSCLRWRWQVRPINKSLLIQRTFLIA